MIAAANPVVWSNTLDGIWNCYVLEQTECSGYLRMESIETGERVLDVLVPISRYFRVQDVLQWGHMCMKEAENYEVA